MIEKFVVQLGNSTSSDLSSLIIIIFFIFCLFVLNDRPSYCTVCVIFALNQTLLQQESLRAGGLQVPYTTEHLIKHYNCGDLNSIIFNHDTSQVPSFKNATLPASEQVTAQEIERYFRQELIYKRNERMGRRVRALLEEQPDKSFFFAFGAGHFLGNNTVIDVLRSEGYEVEHTPAGQTLHSGRRSGELEPFLHESRELQEDEEPHLLELLEKVEHKLKKKHRKKQKKQRHRQFNDLWVRMEESGRRSGELEPFLHESRELQEDEEPHLLELLEKVEHKLKKKHRKKQKKQRHRQFNDLWVRMEESVTAEAPPPVVRIINGYIPVQTHPQEHGRANQHRTFSGSSSWSPALTATALCVQILLLLLS
ncbi:metalloprotease TIKI1-like [Sinocyclocheilus anshuiensis]|uniref:metalloprotease TIKI1-like n=1 Tax=Sinocyclocheilus anshuiensis TaxID=1608454 RepID=UPI0007B8CF0C|nr:PREDICTED: metalloprotease TIKI1-like [Sinocyclocheilus anshuiensis]